MKKFVLLFLFAFVVTNYAQQSPQKSEAEIRRLIKQASSKDDKKSEEAKKSLSEIDAEYIPTLFKVVKKGKPCEQVAVAGMIVDLDRKNKEIVPILVGLARGGNLLSLFNLKEEFNCRRQAFWFLAASGDGIRELTKILKSGDSWEKENVIFAFDDLTETTEYPDDILQAMKEAVPIIAQTVKSKDEVLQEMSEEVLSQIANSDVEGISELAKKYLDENP